MELKKILLVVKGLDLERMTNDTKVIFVWEVLLMQKKDTPQIKYEVGYQLSNGDFSYRELIEEFVGSIDTVYFPWLDVPSGRASLSNRRGFIEWDAQFRLERDLLWLKSKGIKLNLLFNGSCYGSYSVSTHLRNNIISIIEHLGNLDILPDIITTCSPAIGEMIKEAFPQILVRASVNMRIGTIQGMQYLAHIFDEYNMQREYNRNLEHIEKLCEWADKNGKGLIMLANSGCLYNCSAQTFHDNLVSHEKHIAEVQNIKGWSKPYCRRYLSERKNWHAVLQSTWVRPEDIKNYAKFFPVIKLATRMHENPWLVIHSYVTQNFTGSILDLLEPGFSHEMFPFVLSNKAFPDDWFLSTTKCDKNCSECNYCEEVLEKILVNAEEYMI